MSTEHKLSRIDAHAFRYPIDQPVETSFGRMNDRPAVFVRVEDTEGCFGWGEIFANWPAAAAEHRVNLAERDIGPLVIGSTVDDPARAFDDLTRRTHIRALQSGEWGPFRQVIAGIDTALWDLKARAAGLPLRRLLNPGASDRVPAYASGIDIKKAKDRVAHSRDQGYTNFKVKVGFDSARDAELLRELTGTLSDNERLFMDANQAFDLSGALAFLKAVRGLPIDWFEEPIAADGPAQDWAQLANESPIPLAGGENLAGDPAFDAAISQGVLTYLQPDVAKWGGVTGCLRVARAALAAGMTYCPHFLGGGIGLAASGELLAAAGGNGLLEVDVNANPLRSAFNLPGLDQASGLWQLSEAPGLGIEDLPESLLAHESHSVSLVA